MGSERAVRGGYVGLGAWVLQGLVEGSVLSGLGLWVLQGLGEVELSGSGSLEMGLQYLRLEN